ncbi:MAG: ATP-binding protein [Elusimicrobiota bacterium]|jgi:predicted AAA+ superfamily ATPase|nr:ATP-binding protein [Elusimicrobiota bacterium]
MQRQAIDNLIKWKQESNRKPMLIFGMRQVGKTWLMRKFGEENFKNIVYINFDNEPDKKKIFEKDLNTARIIEALGFEAETKINPDDTLIIFDELQECPRAFTSLKYFCENAPQYHIVAAGSLLGVTQHQGTGFPVGKVDMMTLRPMTFLEFLDALDMKNFADLIRNKDFANIELFKDKFIEYLKKYFYVGGMPQAASVYKETQDLFEVRRVQETIIAAYYGDFSKHIPDKEIARVRLIWDCLPNQLAKENKRFLYSDMKDGSRGRNYEIALQWLLNAGLIYKINRVSLPNLPLIAYFQPNIFKLFIPDIGLLSSRARLDLKSYIDSDEKIFNHYKGALSEQFVLQELIATDANLPIYYWANDKNTAEIDFIIQYENGIIPIEVKSEDNVKSLSLKNYIRGFSPNTAIRSSLLNYKKNKEFFDIPLYMISEFRDIIKL